MATTVADLAQRIQLLRAAQLACQRDLQDAEQLEVQALADEQAALDCQRRAQATIAETRRIVHEYAEEIDRLVSEWRALVPEQRTP